MDQQQSKSQRLVALAMLGCLLFNYPLLAVFGDRGFVFGIPSLYVYIFAAWGFLILLVALVAEARE